MDRQDGERTDAVRRIKNRRDFIMHLGAFVIVNAMFVGIWAFSGAGNFWPGWIMLFWGVAVAFHGWWAFFGQPVSERDVRKEIEG